MFATLCKKSVGLTKTLYLKRTARSLSLSKKCFQDENIHGNLHNVSNFSYNEFIDSDSNEKLFLGRMRYVTVSSFQNRLLVDIREHYEKDGEIRPGMKGIALRYNEWKQLKNNIDMIDKKVEDFRKAFGGI